MQHSHFFKKDRTKVSPYPWIRRTTQPAFWPAARLRRTSVSAAGGNLGAEQIYFARAFEIPKGGGRLRRPEPKKKDTTFVVSFFSGGGGGSRTPVRKRFLGNLSGRRRLFTFPCHDASRHASWVGSFIVHAGGKAYSSHVHHLDHAQVRLVVLPGWTAADQAAARTSLSLFFNL